MKYPLRVAIIGMGGFAGSHHLAIKQLEEAGIYRLVCTCDPDPSAFVEKQRELCFQERGVQVFDDYLKMLDSCGSELDMATIPTPINLHAPMHRECVERGLAVYLEKPPTVNYAELEQMIKTEARARFKTMVGFNFIIDPERRKLKQRLIAGEFGKIIHVSAYALWPRNREYYQRAEWAGRLQLDNCLVLDSCIGNATAHQVHNALFWSGPDSLYHWGEPNVTRAEIYRGHPIQGPDTIFVTTRTKGNIELRIGMSHACGGRSRQEESILCDQAMLRYYINNSGPNNSSYAIQWHNGKTEYGPTVEGNFLQMNFVRFAEYLTGRTSRPMTTLEDSRPFVHINNLTYLAARRITPFPETAISRDEDGFIEVAELPESIVDFAASGRLPSLQTRPWARTESGPPATLEDLSRLPSVIAEMAAQK